MTITITLNSSMASASQALLQQPAPKPFSGLSRKELRQIVAEQID